MLSKYHYKAGDVVNSWTVVSQGPPLWGAVAYICRCVCGDELNIQASRLGRGIVTICRKCANRTHGHTVDTSNGYSSYMKMQARCYSEKQEGYEHYGGRGIRVCERWLESFENFLADMGPRPSKAHSLDRRDVNGDYEPGNCRWATRREQARNTTRNHQIEWNGRTWCIQDLAAEFGMTAMQVLYFQRRGVSLDEMRERGLKWKEMKARGARQWSTKFIELNGREMSIADWERELGYPPGQLSYRVNHMAPEKALVPYRPKFQKKRAA